VVKTNTFEQVAKIGRDHVTLRRVGIVSTSPPVRREEFRFALSHLTRAARPGWVGP
jgi:hypothetical protein